MNVFVKTKKHKINHGIRSNLSMVNRWKLKKGSMKYTTARHTKIISFVLLTIFELETHNIN